MLGVLFQASELNQNPDGMIPRNHRPLVGCGQNLWQEAANRLRYLEGDGVQRGHRTPRKLVIVALKQFSEFFVITSNQIRFPLTDLVENRNTVALDVFVLIPKVFDELSDGALVAGSDNFLGQRLIGNLIPAVKRAGQLAQGCL